MTRYEFDLAKMTPAAREVWLSVYEVGYEHGLDAGYRQCEADDAARWAELRQSIRATANTPPYDVLAERRGQHDRAEAHRALLRERGVA